MLTLYVAAATAYRLGAPATWQAHSTLASPVAKDKVSIGIAMCAAATDPPKKMKQRDVDLSNPVQTFEFLCSISGTPPGRDAEMDFDGFSLAFEQLFNSGMPLDPEAQDELRAAVESNDDEDVSAANWNKFHRRWRESSSAAAYLDSIVRKKEEAKAAQKREKEFEKKLAAVRLATESQAAAKAKEERPKLMSEIGRGKDDGMGPMGAAQLAAQHRTLDPAAWVEVTDGVGGMDAALEVIRRRIWVPLCAPTKLLEELGAQRVKGLLLHGPPGCGKSLLAAKLAEGLSRRPPTLVSGPEIMDKFVGSSEAALRQLFTTPPAVTPRPGDAPDVMQVLAAALRVHWPSMAFRRPSIGFPSAFP